MDLEKLFLLQSFALAWHWVNSACALVDEKKSYKLLGEKEYKRIETNTHNLAGYFYPQLDSKYATKQLMTNFICPIPVANSVFTESALKTAFRLGTKQIIAINQGYSLPNCSDNDVKMFDINKVSCKSATEMLALCNFDRAKPVFVTLGCLPLLAQKEDFSGLLNCLCEVICPGSSVVFSYGDENFYSENAGKGPLFIKEITQTDCNSGYSYTEIEKLLSQRGFLIYEHLTREDMQQQYFTNHNAINSANLTAMESVCYILAVRKEHKI